MIALQTLIVSFAFSFVGSIPPGTINISVIQLSLDRKYYAAIRFALAAAIVEYPYAFIAVRFEEYITSTPLVVENFTIIAGLAMILLGILNLWPSKQPLQITEKYKHSGFRKGVVISMLNPLAIPFWIGVTAYLKSNGWVSTDNNLIYLYVLGVSAGTFALLLMLAVLAKKATRFVEQGLWLKKLPGTIFLLLGIYTLGRYFLL